jgi:hypothetical protein
MDFLWISELSLVYYAGATVINTYFNTLGFGVC